MSRRAILGAGAALLVVVAVVWLSQPRQDSFERAPLDPRGTGPSGTAALVELLRAHGATVRLGGQVSEDDDVVLQLADTLSGAPAARLDEWVRAGGRLVVADPSAPAARPDGVGPLTESSTPGDCDIAALSDLREVRPALPALFGPVEGSSICFREATAGAGGIRMTTSGAGAVVAVAGTGPLLNTSLDEADNAALALRLLTPGTSEIRILDPNRLLSDSDDVGDGTVLGSLPVPGRQALAQLVLAFAVWGLARGRRLGRPVTEELPVPLPASDLVLATGRLLDRNDDPAAAAERLRRRAMRRLGVAVGLGATPDPVELVTALEGRPGVDPSMARRALLAPVSDNAALVSTAAHLDRLQKELSP